MSELKERFLTVYKETVTRAGSDSLLDWLEHSDFFVAPASTKYHGCYEGGLLQHSLNVYDCLKIGIEAAGLQGVYSEETIAIVSLMHDLCKVNYYKKGSRNVKDEETGQWYKKEVYEVDEKFPCGEHADKSIGENKLRKIVSENKDADFVLWNGTRPQIKRTKFERFVDQLNLI